MWSFFPSWATQKYGALKYVRNQQVRQSQPHHTTQCFSLCFLMRQTINFSSSHSKLFSPIQARTLVLVSPGEFTPASAVLQFLVFLLKEDEELILGAGGNHPRDFAFPERQHHSPVLLPRRDVSRAQLAPSLQPQKKAESKYCRINTGDARGNGRAHAVGCVFLKEEGSKKGGLQYWTF